MITAASEIESVQGLSDAVEKINEIEPSKIKQFFLDQIPWLLDFGLKVLGVLVILFIGLKIIKFVRKVTHKSMERSGADVGVMQFIDSFIKAIMYIILGMVVLNKFGIPVTSFVAVLGSAGLAIGLALQGSLSNFAGGVLILLLKPFRVGDYIVEDLHNNEGTVIEIQLFYTKLLTYDNKSIIIPNGTLANSSLTNATSQDKRKLDIGVGISYDADLLLAKEIIHDILLSDSAVLNDEERVVFVDKLGDSAVKLGCRAWVRTEDYWPAKWRITEEIKLTFDKHKIEIPFNQLDVNIKDQKERNTEQHNRN